MLACPRAEAWDSGTHRLITRLAIDALQPSALRDLMAHNRAAVQQYAVVPDTVLKELHGQAEKQRHYVNLEYFGAAPFDAMVPDLQAMDRRFGVARVMRAGTLPWTIEDVSGRLGLAWSTGDCGHVLVLSGYLSHYVGDLSQPLHSTKHWDGFAPRDRGMHARIELAVDHSTRELEADARAAVHVRKLDSIWNAELDELRESNAHLGEIVKADRAARAASGSEERVYERAFVERERELIVRQVSGSASLLASIWQYEWQHAGSTRACASGDP